MVFVPRATASSSMLKVKVTLPVPSKFCAEAVASPVIENVLVVARAVAVAALPEADAATTFKASINALSTYESIYA